MSTVADKLAKKSTHRSSAKQVRLRLVYIDFWSAVKLSFLAAIAIAIVTVVSFVMVYLVVRTTGLIDKADEFLGGSGKSRAAVRLVIGGALALIATWVVGTLLGTTVA